MNKESVMREPVLDNILLKHIDFLKKEMFSSIESTMKPHNLLGCAILLTSYTEILGGYVTGKLTEGGNRENYEKFLGYLGKHYVELDKKLQDYDKKLNKKFKKEKKKDVKIHLGLYGRVRNFLLHQGRIKGGWAIHSSKIDKSSGINYTKMGHLTINVRTYFSDFKNGFEKYEQELKDSTFNDQLYQNFLNASLYDLSVDYGEFNELSENKYDSVNS